MVSKNQIKLISSLHLKKNRIANQLFIAEGVKVIQELLKSNFILEHLYCTEPLFDEVPLPLKSLISESELKKISALSTPNNCLAVFKIPASMPILDKGLILALDDIRDPGNLGTILRLCDWFGISQVVCSEQTVDLYNPKVVQATMGYYCIFQTKFFVFYNKIIFTKFFLAHFWYFYGWVQCLYGNPAERGYCNNGK